MRLYPDVPAARTRAIARDVLVLAAVVFFAWAGFKVHDTVLQLNALSRGVQDAGSAVQDGFRSAAGAVNGLPVVGGSLADGLNSAGGATGGNVLDAGRAGERAVGKTANALGWATFLLPTLVLAIFFVPLRVREVRRMRDAQRLLGAALTPARRRLLAMRAAFGLPFADLEPFTADPIGDLEAERFEPLLEALYAQSGLLPPPALPPAT